jgi:hypothetical protein
MFYLLEPPVTCHSFLNFHLHFSRLSRQRRSLLRSESVILLVDSLYAEAIDAVKLWAPLSASSPKLIWILGEINSEARLWNYSQSVNFSTGSKRFLVNMIQQVENKWWVSWVQNVKQWILTAGHSCAQQYPACHHFPQDSNEWDTVVLSNSFIRSKFSSFRPEGLETTLFQNGCLLFRSPTSSDLCLKLKGSLMFESFQAWPGDLQTAVSSTSVLPIGMQTPVASIETSGGRSTPKLQRQ